MTGYLLRSALYWSTIHVDIQRKNSSYIMIYTATFFTGVESIVFRMSHISTESIHPPHLTNFTYIYKDTSFLWKDLLTASSLPDHWRIWSNADYTLKSTPSPTSPMGMASTLKKCTMMVTMINSIKPPTHGLTKDTQGLMNGNFGVSLWSKAPQMIITQPIFTN